MATWTPNPFYYDFGRPFPSKHVLSLFKESKIFKEFKTKKTVHIYEPCAGTGRIIIPLSINYPSIQFIASDISENMLSVLNYRIACENITNLISHESDILRFSTDAPSDLIIVSSALHAIPLWKEALNFLAKQLTPQGAICLIGEEADLYNEALGRSSFIFNNQETDGILKKFWEIYRIARKEVSAYDTEKSQVGCSWEINNKEGVDYLKNIGFSVYEKTEVNWMQNLSICTLLKIVKHRCYSSMFTIEDEIYDIIRTKVLTESKKLENCQAVSRHSSMALFMKR